MIFRLHVCPKPSKNLKNRCLGMLLIKPAYGNALCIFITTCGVMGLVRFELWLYG
jgi:hypothetical protein